MGRVLNVVYSLSPNVLVSKISGTPQKPWYDSQDDESLLPKINFSTTPCGIIYDEKDDLSSEEELPIFVDEGAITVLSIDEIRSMKPNNKQFHQTFSTGHLIMDSIDIIDEETDEEDLLTPPAR